MLQDKWIEFAVELQSLAQAGLAYGKDVYDLERYTRIREIGSGDDRMQKRYSAGKSKKSVLQRNRLSDSKSRYKGGCF